MTICDRYDQLADEVNGLSVGKAQGVILNRLEECHEKENIMSKMQGAETSDIAEQNQVNLTKIHIFYTFYFVFPRF